MKNYTQSPRQKSPPSVQSAGSNVISPRQKVEFYSGARFDTFLPSASALPMPPVQWIDSNATRSQSTPSSPIPKNSISATKSIDIAAVFGSLNVQQQQQPNKTTNINNMPHGPAVKQVLKSNSYPGEKVMRPRFEHPQHQQQTNNKKVVGKPEFRGKQRSQAQQPNVEGKNRKQQKDKKPTAATSKTLISTTAAATPTSGHTKTEKTQNSPGPISAKEFGQDLMTMLGVTPTKNPPKSPEKEGKIPVISYDYGFYGRPSSPEKYQEITNNLKLLLKVQA